MKDNRGDMDIAREGVCSADMREVGGDDVGASSGGESAMIVNGTGVDRNSAEVDSTEVAVESNVSTDRLRNMQ